jgi:hypothetical protein
MTLPLRLLLLFAVAAVAAIVLWPNSASLPFQPGKPYTGPGFEVVADTPCPISGWIALAPENASSTVTAAATPSLAIAPTPTTTTTTTAATTPAPAPPVYSIVCVQPVYIQPVSANGTMAVQVAGVWLGENGPNVDEYNLYYLTVPPNVSFVVYGGQAYLASKQYLMPFNYTLYVVEPAVAVPNIMDWRYVGDMDVKYYGFLEVYHLYLADVTWRFYKADYVNATITADPAMYYFLPRK